MSKLLLVLIGILFTLPSHAQEQDPFRITVRDGQIDVQTFYLITGEGNIELDSIELRTISPNWIKAINVVTELQDSTDIVSPNSVTVASIFIELKKKRLKKFLESHSKGKNNI
ncbi:MAG: hypothetical protein ABJG47_18545 [Ekhidna sp.]